MVRLFIVLTKIPQFLKTLQINLGIIRERRIHQYKLFLCSLRIQMHYRRRVREKFGDMRMEKRR